ncbi:M24 family metallopeptidase [Polaromonas sp.]|uniref:M24 family metallopeptidase n=1 Tax=Polaromonas sp. TaxID=1869339 RepID=UPI0025F9BCB8|nr:M24 family metallopeptidase [Polaromonas sp.]
MPLSERNSRWDRLRKKMRFAGVDALVFLGNDIYWGMGMANMRYMFQVESQIGGDALFPMEGDPVIWTAPVHMHRPTSMYLSIQDWVSDIRPKGGPTAIAGEIHAKALQASKIGLVGFSNTLQTTNLLMYEVESLKKLLPGANFVDMTWAVEEMRMIKSELEIDMLRKASVISRKVIDAMVVAAGQSGATEASVYAEMVRTQISNGAEPYIFNLLASGPIEHPKEEIWHLLHGCEQPLTPSMRPLEKNDLIIAEWHTKYGGYRCHSEYTVYVGKKPPPQLQRIWDVSCECLEASKEALVAGRTIREAIEIIERPARKAKLDWVELGFHAMGTASPEFPTVVYPAGFGPAANGAGMQDLVLETGMTFGNNIDLHDSAWKPDVGCMYSDFMVVRESRAECLVNVPSEMGITG